MKKLLMTLMFISVTLALSACNTINGFGKDIKKAGEQVEEASKK